MKGWTIRDERPGDEAAIAALTEIAFRSVRHSDGSETAIIERLRAAGDLTLSLVAQNLDQAIIGHVAFSRVAISDGTPGWYGLGPISVIPLRQRAGIGGHWRWKASLGCAKSLPEAAWCSAIPSITGPSASITTRGLSSRARRPNTSSAWS